MPPIMANSNDTQGHKDKNTFSHGIFMWNMKTLCTKVITKVKLLKKKAKPYGQGHRVKNVGMLGTILSQGILMWNMKALAFTVQNLLSRLEF